MGSQGFNNTGYDIYTGSPEALAYSINSSGDITLPKQVSFFATIQIETNVTGDGTVFQPGSTVPVVITRNIGSAFSAGNGAGTGCLFTAPTNGIYLISFNIWYKAHNAGGGTTAVAQIITTSYTYTVYNLPTEQKIPNFFGTNEFITYSGVVLASMSATDTAIFALTSAGGVKNVSCEGGYISGLLKA